MNRMREVDSLSLAERWLLASTYKLAGKPEVAKALVDKDRVQALVFADANPYTFGSLMRDRAVVLMGMTLLGREAETGPLLEDVAAQLSDGSWYSTQSVAFALVAVRRTPTKSFTGFSFDYAAGAARKQTIRVMRQSQHQTTPAAATGAHDAHQHLGASCRHGCGACDTAQRRGNISANGLTLTVGYSDADGAPRRAPRRPGQRSRRTAHGQKRQQTPARQLALSQPGPRLEIRNRLEGVDTQGERSAEKQPLGQFWWVPAEWRKQALRTAEYADIRDDRAAFQPGPGESIFFETWLNAAYLGKFYLPGAGVEAIRSHATREGQGPMGRSDHHSVEGARRRHRRVLAAVVCAHARGHRILGVSRQAVRRVLRARARDGTLLSARIASDGQWRFPPDHRARKFRRAPLVLRQALRAALRHRWPGDRAPPG
jgi:hypothetical protein